MVLCRIANSSPRRRAPRPGAALSLLLVLAGCKLPRTTASGEAGNVVAQGDLAYVTLAEGGIGVFDVPGRRTLRTLPPPEGSGSVDDLALAPGLLFALDAKPPGFLSVYSLAEPRDPRLVSPPVPVPVGPFSGVSAASGRVVVSGGTSEMSVLRYGPDGRLGPERSTLDLGRGQPDVLLSPDGKHAFVSTHFSLLRGTFGLTTVRVEEPPRPSVRLAALELPGAGFSPGGARPANFPLEAALAGDVLFLAQGSGLAVLDVSDPASPRLLSTVSLGLAGVSVDVRGALAAVVGSAPEPTLVLLDVAEPRSPRLLRKVSLPAGSRPTGVALADGAAVVAAQGAGPLAIALEALGGR
ncbi:MAG TPA: hypothetical protein VFI25_05150 [Planctomycetota bacterium]|nr:hypothetical protein [Planctomycetota bacterium]